MALEASVKKQMAAKLEEMKPQMEAAEAWIEAVIGEPMEGTFDEWLRSGVVLCKLLNGVAPGSVKKIATSSMPFKQMENISLFIRGIKKLGVHDSDCFDTNDLYKGQDIGKVVQCVHSLGSVVQKRCKDYAGPQLGVKLADANKREFTEDQLKEARAATSKLSAGSSATMERNDVLKSGITMGNTYAGGAGSSEASKLASGSASTMERSEVIKSGITMGNTYAGGAGSSEASKLASGSAATMERTGVVKAGITFGNDQSGDGSNEMSKMTIGSAGQMERSEVLKTGITFGNASAGAGAADASKATQGSSATMDRAAMPQDNIMKNVS